MARATAAGPFTPAGTDRAFELLDLLLDLVRPVELEDEVAGRAGDLARSRRLRGSDAIHLASYERIQAGDAVLVCADGDLADAAISFGYAVALPGAG